MKVFVFLAIVALATASTDYDTVLQSPGQLKALFSQFTRTFHKQFSREESPMRLRLFRSDLKKIVQLNKVHAGHWESGLNMFAAMTEFEKEQYLGLNSSLPAEVPEAAPILSSVASNAVELDWRKLGKVAGVKNQGRCGSCWAFSAVGAVETNYAIQTGRRKQFSEQEYLDCTYENEAGRDGCSGGWYYQSWDYSRRTGRLATLDAASYKQKDGRCAYSGVHNGLISAKISAVKTVWNGEASMIKELNNGAVSVAFEVTDAFFKYTSGIIRDDTCKSWANHAVTAVGYTKNALIVKNSWGSWGERGYFRTARGHHGCRIYSYGKVPKWKSTGLVDTDAEYVPKDDNNCSGTNADGCPCGTVRCSSGQCKHAHMCH